MTICELISILETVRQEHGNIDVRTFKGSNYTSIGQITFHEGHPVYWKGATKLEPAGWNSPDFICIG